MVDTINNHVYNNWIEFTPITLSVFGDSKWFCDFDFNYSFCIEG